MKDMVYREWQKEPEILDSGIYKGRKYVIYSLGHHPTAYVELRNAELNKSDDYDHYDLEVHCGFTYLGKLKCDIFTTYIGWDYAHCCDYCYDEHQYGIYGNKKWTTQEILNEVKSVIAQFEKGEWVDGYFKVVDNGDEE